MSRGNVNEESREGKGSVGEKKYGQKDKQLEENRERKQKSQPTRSKSGTKYTACSLDSVFL